MTTNTIISVADYYGTKGARELVHRVKNNDVEAIAIMARAMAAVAIERLPADCILIPVPSHTGRASNTLDLAKQISALTGFPVFDIINGSHRDTWYSVKQQGVSAMDITTEFFDFKLLHEIAPHKAIIIDMVFDTGCTIAAISKLFNRPITILIYAKVKQNCASNSVQNTNCHTTIPNATPTKNQKKVTLG